MNLIESYPRRSPIIHRVRVASTLSLVKAIASVWPHLTFDEIVQMLDRTPHLYDKLWCVALPASILTAASGTFTWPGGVGQAWGQLVGGGGGGGGGGKASTGTSGNCAGAGGGAGGGGAFPWFGILPGVPNTAYAWTNGTVGSAGAGSTTNGAGNATNGGSGGNTSFGSGPSCIGIAYGATGGVAGGSVVQPSSSAGIAGTPGGSPSAQDTVNQLFAGNGGAGGSNAVGSNGVVENGGFGENANATPARGTGGTNVNARGGGGGGGAGMGNSLARGGVGGAGGNDAPTNSVQPTTPAVPTANSGCGGGGGGGSGAAGSTSGSGGNGQTNFWYWKN